MRPEGLGVLSRPQLGERQVRVHAERGPGRAPELERGGKLVPVSLAFASQNFTAEAEGDACSERATRSGPVMRSAQAARPGRSSTASAATPGFLDVKSSSRRPECHAVARGGRRPYSGRQTRVSSGLHQG